MKKQVRFLLLLAALLVPWVTQAQDVTGSAIFRTGVDTTRWIPLTSAAQSPTFSDADDGAASAQNIGFTFAFGEDTVSQFSLSTNGRIQLGSTTAPSTTSKVFSVATASYFPVISGYSTDTRVDQSADCYAKYELTGTAPNRILVIEYKQPYYYSSSVTSRINYQVHLYEDSAKVVIVYGTNTGTDINTFQAGFGVAANDILAINTTTHTASAVAAPYSTTNGTSAWPGNGRYYEMVFPKSLNCLRPELTDVTATVDSAYFSWTSTAGSFVLEYADSAFTPGANQATVINTNSLEYALSNLNPNTVYYYALKAECDANNASLWRSGTFNTACVPTYYPLTYGFEATDSLADCWHYGITTTSTSSASSYINPGYSGGSEGSQCLYLYPYYYYNNVLWAVMPIINGTLSDMMVSFDMRSTSTSSSNVPPLQVGYMTNVEDPTTFVPFYSNAINSTEWTRGYISFPDSITYPSGARIAFMVNSTGYSSYRSFQIDQVEVSALPECPIVENVAATAGVGAAIITWNYNAHTSSNVPEEYEISYAPLTDSGDIVPGSIVSAGTTSEISYSLSGLTANSKYRVYVAPVCDGSTSSMDSADFSTGSLPCISFDTVNPGDTNIVGTGTSTSATLVFSSSYDYRYQQMIYTADELGGAMNITSVAFQRRAGDVTPVTNTESIEIYLANVSQSSLSSGFVPYNAGTFQKVYDADTYTLTDTGWVEFVFDEPFAYNGSENLLLVINSGVTTWTSDKYFYYTSVSGSGRYRQQDNTPINGQTTQSGGSSISTRLNIRFTTTDCLEHGQCARPMVAVSQVDDTSAHIVWTPGYQENEWDVFYRRQGATAWIPVAIGTTETNTTLSGLQGGADYEVGVMGICEDSLMGIVNFSTECGMIYRNSLPYIMDITTQAGGGSSGTQPTCWTRPTGSNSSYPYMYGYSAGGRMPTLYWYAYSSGANGMMALPESEMGVDSLEIYLDLYRSSASYSGTLVVGVMDDPTDLTTFVPVDTVTVPIVGSWVTVDADLSSYTGTGRYITLMQDKTLCVPGNTSDYIYMSKIEVARRAACRPLTMYYAGNITYESADINIQDAENDDAENYILYYGLVNDINAATDSMVFTGTTVSLTNLHYDTTYYVWVGVQCSEDDSRMRLISFKTLPPCMLVENLTMQTSAANGTAVLSWEPPTEAFPATAYVVSYMAAGDTTWNTDTVTNTYYVLSGLRNNINYSYSVSTICSEHAGLTHSSDLVIADACAYVGNEDGVQPYTPIYGYYQYSYSQNIYLANELNAIGDTLYGIFYTQTETDAEPYTYVIDAYLGQTDDTAFADEYSWLPVDSLTQVAANHVLYIDHAGTYYIPFSTPFVRNANRNLVVAIDKNSEDYIDIYPQWMSTVTTGTRSIITYEDGIDIDIDGISSYYGDLGEFVPDVLFSAACDNPTPMACSEPLLICSGKTATSLDIRWYAGGSETTWNVDYRPDGATAWTSLLANTTLDSATITGLSSGLLYEVRVTSFCGGDTLVNTQVFSTACGSIALPYVENFHAAANGTYARSCWQAGADNEIYPTVGNYVGFGKMVLIDDGAFLVAPTFNVPVNQVQVNVTHWGTIPGTFIYAGIITDAASTQTFIPFDTLYSWNETMLSNTTVHFNGYTGTEGNICFFVPTGYPVTGQHFIKNLIFDLNVNCPSVDSIWTVSTAGTDATVAWSTDGIGTASSYLVEYDTAGFTPGTGTVISASNASATFNNLLQSTVYDVYVTPICSNGDTMYRSAVYRFTSDCGAMSIPYTMNFDLPYLPALTATHMMPACWTYEMLATGTSATTYYDPQIYLSDNYATSGRHVLYTYYRSVMALPEMAEPLDTLQVSFYAYGSSTYYQLVVGVVDSVTPGFAASFIPIDTIDVNNGGAGVYDTVTFCGFSAPGQRIAFKNQYRGTSSSSYVYIDDVVVDYRPACMPVNSIAMATNSETTATISWNACGTSPTFELEYGPKDFVQGQGTTVTTTNANYTFTGLSANMFCDVYIRTVCGAGEYSEWSKGFFYTSMVCDDNIAIPMYDTSATAVDTVSQHVPANSYYNYGFTEVIYDSAMLANAGFTAGSLISGFAFYPTTFSTYRNYYTNCQVYMKHTDKDEFSSNSDVEAMTAADFVFDGDLNWTDSTVQRVVMFNRAFVWDGEHNIIIAIDRNHGSYSSGARFAAQTDTAKTRVLYSYSDSYNVDPFTLNGFSSTSKGTSNDVPNFDFFSCLTGLCSTPFVTVATTYNDATLSWTSEAADFEVAVKAFADATWPTETAVANAYSYVATGLQPATQYQYRVRAICSEDEISNWAEGSFTTDSLPCFAPSNLTATPGLGNAEMSWTNGSNETEWNIHVWNTAFDQTFNVTGNPATVTGLTPGTEYYAAIQAVCGGGMVISDYGDTISFTTDVCDPVTNVTATVEGSTATVTWTAGDNNTGQFAIEYGYEGFAAGTGTTLTATSNSITITDLESETSYDVYVRAICEGQYNSVWSDPASFETAIGIDAVNGNNAVTIYPNPAEQSTTIRVNGVEGIVSVTIVDMTGRTVSTSSLECSGDCEKLMNVTDLAAGSYFVRLQGNGLDTVKKLVIK